MGNGVDENTDGRLTMTYLSFLMDVLAADPQAGAFAWRGNIITRGQLHDAISSNKEHLVKAGICSGDPVLLQADYGPETTGLLLALIDLKAIIIPLVPQNAERSPKLIDMVDPVWVIRVDDDGAITITPRQSTGGNDLYRQLQERRSSGLVLFTSGSTGTPKAVVHDFAKLLVKFTKPRPSMVILNFLMFDHWGGLNTLLHCLATGSLIVFPQQRTPEHICELIERHGIELLPATPTFLNMLLISRAFEGRDLSSLKLISYGAEPMPASTLEGLSKAFPNTELRQTYGMIELGVLRAQSKSSDSLWVRIGGEGYDTRVVDGILQIKADAAMLGYLNAPSPITDDGYFITGDRVEVDGDFMKILGRDSELINVGGQKVYPAEVEAILLEHDDVEDAVVYGESNPITGKIVCATVRRRAGVDGATVRQDIKRFCNKRLESFKVPVKIRLVDEALHGDRQKRMRRQPVPLSDNE